MNYWKRLSNSKIFKISYYMFNVTIMVLAVYYLLELLNVFEKLNMSSNTKSLAMVGFVSLFIFAFSTAGIIYCLEKELNKSNESK